MEYTVVAVAETEAVVAADDDGGDVILVVAADDGGDVVLAGDCAAVTDAGAADIYIYIY